MEIRKDSQVQQGGMPDAAQLAAINALAKAELTAEQVYAFSLRLCDDQVDRDFERFDTQALPALARLFIGKTGTVDHRWSAESQVARIFGAEVHSEGGVSFIKAWAYIRRGGKGDEWIADIEAGIKKEVSVGCAMGSSVCSICGCDYGTCGHQKGQEYEGVLCCAILREPVDAYEFSFVAVPAQREAGVLKGLHSPVSLKELAREHGAQEEYRSLYKLAQLGKEYSGVLENEVVRLCRLLELELEEAVLRSMVKSIGTGELGKLKAALEARVARHYPLMPQLPGRERTEELESGFMI